MSERLLRAAQLLAAAAELLAREVAAAEAVVPPARPEAYGVREVAALLHRPVSTVRQWAEEGAFPNARKERGRWMVPAGSVEQFIAGLPPKPTRDVAAGATIAPAPNPGPGPGRARDAGAPDLGAWRRARRAER